VGAFRLLVGLLGTALMAVAVMATRLGLDHNTEWGAGRQRLLAVGLTLLAAGLWPWLRGLYLSAEEAGPSVGRRTRAALSPFPAGRSFLGWLETVRGVSRKAISSITLSLDRSSLSERSRRRLAISTALAAVVAVEVVYVFIISVGSWNRWPVETAYYSLLSEAFRRGQVHLVVEPDSRLATLGDPYDFPARQDIPVLWDASYHEGKYYLYWGPAPALLLAMAESLSGKGIGDQYLVFFFVSLVNIFLAWILFYIWRKLFSGTSPLLLAVFVAGAGLAGPLPWLLGRPEIYEAAIAGGQAFLLLGLAAVLPEWIEGRTSPGRLVVAGIAWSLAAGSRPTLLLAFLPGTAWLVVVWLRQRPVPWRSLASILLPLAIGGLALAGYNFARFGSPLETGITYTLTGRNQRANADEMFSIRYVTSNLFNYLWMPPRSLSVFPFIKSQGGMTSVPIFGSRPGELYSTELITGVLRTTPFVWLALYSVGGVLLGRVRGRRLSPPSLETLSLVLAAMVLGGFAGLVGFLFATMRYEADFVPTLYLLAAIGAWMVIEDLRGHRLWRLAATLVVAWLSVYGIRQGVLLAITGYNARFEALNPVLFDQLTRFFAR
jgi:hypothetical protein